MSLMAISVFLLVVGQLEAAPDEQSWLYLDGQSIPRSSVSSGELQLGIVEDTKCSSAQALCVIAFIRNRSNLLVRLVQPGDGSLVGARDPGVRWLVTELSSDETDPPTNFMDYFDSGCGVINSLRSDEIVDLAPGAIMELGPWLRKPIHPAPKAPIRLRLFYDLGATGAMMRGPFLTGVAPDLIERYLSATRCSLASNLLVIYPGALKCGLSPRRREEPQTAPLGR